MATLTVVSDLHLEARPLSLGEVLDRNICSDVLCLLGDIGDPGSETYRDLLAACSARFPTVLLLAGNNEYRNHHGGSRTMAQTEELIRQAVKAHPNVHFLQNATHVLGGIAFIGTTLWSYLPDTPLPPPPSEEEEKTTASGKDSRAEAGGDDGGGGAAAAEIAATVKPVAALPPLLPVAGVADPMPDTGLAAPAASTAAMNVQSLKDVLASVPISSFSSAETVGAAVTAEHGDAATAAPQQPPDLSQRLPPPPPSSPKHDERWQQVGPSFASIGAVLPMQWISSPQVEHSGGIPIPSPLSTRLRPTSAVIDCSVANKNASGDSGGAALPQLLAPAARRGTTIATPRFWSYLQPPPDWLTSVDLGTLCSSAISGDGCGGGCGGCRSASSGSAGWICGQRRMRHCVSLASLQPGEPCPSWRPVQAGCRASSGSSSRSSSSSSDSGSGSSRSSDGSDVEQSDTMSQHSSAGGIGVLVQPSMPNAATSTGRVDAAAAAVAFPDLAASANALMGTSEPTSARTSAGAAVNLPSARVLSLPASALLAAADADADADAAIPGFLSDPGSDGYAPDDAGGVGRAQESSATSAIAGAAAAAAAPPLATGSTASHVVAASVTVSASAAAAAAGTAPPPKPSGSHHPLPHHHHPHHPHHRHHRHSGTSASHLPPPATIREFIGATSLDYRRIFASPGGPAITPDVTNGLFHASLEFVRTAVVNAHQNGLVPVVLSHHAPSMRGTSRPAFADHPSTHAYSTDLDSYLAVSGIAAWYCGHTHYNFDLQFPGGVRLASNQFGSQSKPAEGYSRSWQHRLPAAAGNNSVGVGDGGVLHMSAVAAAAAAAADAARFSNSSNGAKADKFPPVQDECSWTQSRTEPPPRAFGVPSTPSLRAWAC